MSLILSGIQTVTVLLRSGLTNRVINPRTISRFAVLREKQNEGEASLESEAKDEAEREIDKSKDRSKVIPVDISIKYLQSDAYKETYGTDPVWKLYRRNHKGQLPPRKTRQTCIRYDKIATGSPCPICRDEYLVLDYRNVDLLKQFISEYTGEILSYQKTGICQKRYKQLQIAVHKARDYGTVSYGVPFRHYNYSEWKPIEN